MTESHPAQPPSAKEEPQESRLSNQATQPQAELSKLMQRHLEEFREAISAYLIVPENPLGSGPVFEELAFAAD